MRTLDHALLLRREAGRELRALRLARDLTPAAFGAALGSSNPAKAAQRVAGLESGQKLPDPQTRAVIVARLGRLPTGWDDADALEARANRARASVMLREIDLLSRVLPRLVARRADLPSGWRDIPIHGLRSGSTITGTLPMTVGHLVHGLRPGGPLHVAHKGEPMWLVSAGGSLQTGSGYVELFSPRGERRTLPASEMDGVGRNLHLLRQAREGAVSPGPTRWSLATVACALGLEVAPVRLTRADGTPLAAWDPKSGDLRDAGGVRLDTTPSPDDEAAWAARSAPPPWPERHAGWFEGADGRVVAFFDGWLPDGLFVTDPT